MPANPYAEKTVLVTGGTGSFRNFVVRRLLELGATLACPPRLLQ